MTEDFALIDFALSARPPAEVAEAIGRVRAEQAPEEPPRRGFLSRILSGLRRGEAGGKRPPGLTLHPANTLADWPLTRVVLADGMPAAANTPFRISGPIGMAGLTLIEFREDDQESSPLCEALSAELPGDELFYFRHSGSRHPGAHFAFHVYRDGRATRRAASVSADGIMAEAAWKGLDSGMPHPLETDSLPAPGTPNSEVMTPVRQAIILEALGVDPEALFAAGEEPGMVVLELSTEPGGRPLWEAAAFVEDQLRGPGDPAPAKFAPGDGPEEESFRPDLGDADRAARAPTQSAARHAEESDAPASWEEEVTALLVSAVETSLPADEQVAWLDQLTSQLLGGDVDGALEEARRMIGTGTRSPAEKQADIARLAQLFGR